VSALTEIVAEMGGICTAHIRNEMDQISDALDEAFQAIRSTKVPLIISHHKCAGIKNWGRSGETLAMIDAANRHSPVGLDCYPYIAGSTIIIPDLVDGEIDILITWSEKHPDVSGRYLKDICAEWNCSEREAAERLVPGGACYFQMNEKDVRRILQHPRCMIGSDGLPSDPNPHPRLWGTFPRVLGHYARDVGLFSLETAVHKMTGLAARTFGLMNRGVLKSGNRADIVIFDPETIMDGATFDTPIQVALGIEDVYVNGELTWSGGQHTAKYNGKYLSGNAN